MSNYRLEIPPGPWGTIVADPPWRLDIGGVKRKLHYDTMSRDEILLIGEKLKDKLLPQAHLWLWTTNPHLLDGSAHAVLKWWGFTPKGLLTWDKQRMGIGWWLRSATEHVILAVRTNKGRVQPSTYTTIVRGGWRRHSQKPEAFYKWPEALSPGPRLELFAREQREGWTCLVTDAPPVGDPYGQG